MLPVKTTGSPLLEGSLMVSVRLSPARRTNGPAGRLSVSESPLVGSVKVVLTGFEPLLNSSTIVLSKLTVELLKSSGTMMSPARVEPSIKKSPVAFVMLKTAGEPNETSRSKSPSAMACEPLASVVSWKVTVAVIDRAG